MSFQPCKRSSLDHHVSQPKSHTLGNMYLSVGDKTTRTNSCGRSLESAGGWGWLDGDEVQAVADIASVVERYRD